MRILLVEDDEVMLEALTEILSKQNYIVDVARDGLAGWEFVQTYAYDLVLLDVVLPKLDGISFCRQLRDQENQVLVMLLTARDTTTDKLLGLGSGADDYLVKPFNVEELVARIRALLRRGSTATASPVLVCGQLYLDTNTHAVTYGDQALQFSRKEYLLLELFLRNQRRIYSRREIVDHLWAFDADPPDEATVRSHIKNLRKELKTVGLEDLIETLYGQGYRINPAYVTETTAQATLDAAKEQMLDGTVAKIWERTKSTSFDRVLFLERVVQSLKSGMLDRDSHQKAIQQAHKLVGSLGTFGFEAGSELAQQLEVSLQAELEERPEFSPPLQQQMMQQLKPLVSSVQQVFQESASTSESGQPNQSFQNKVLAVDDDPQILIILKALLEPLGVQLTGLEEPERFWETLRSLQPDLLILDVNLPNVNGLELCRSVREDAQWHWLPIVLLTVCTDRETLQQAFLCGADDYVTKPILPAELSTRILNRLKRSQSLRMLAATETLNSITNPHQATQALQQLLQIAARSHQTVCLVILDLEHDQAIALSSDRAQINASLQQFGQFLNQNLRSGDVVAHWEAGKFVLGLYGANREEGIEQLTAFLAAWRSQPFTTVNGTALPMNFSAGIAQYPIDGADFQRLYQVAEAVSLRAKAAGHNQILAAG